MFKIQGFLNTELSYNTVLFESAMLYQEKQQLTESGLSYRLWTNMSLFMPQDQMRIKTISTLWKGCTVFGKIELS